LSKRTAVVPVRNETARTLEAVVASIDSGRVWPPRTLAAEPRLKWSVTDPGAVPASIDVRHGRGALDTAHG